MKRGMALILVATLAGCSVKTTEQPDAAPESTTPDTVAGFDNRNYESRFALEHYRPMTNPEQNEIQVIDSACAVFVYPTDDQFEKMEDEFGVDLATLADDNSFYDAEAAMKLDSAGIRTVDAEKRFLHFKGATESWLLDIRKEGAPEWNLIFFKTNGKPEIVTSIDVTSERITSYFKNEK
jgi:hypothetical protein